MSNPPIPKNPTPIPQVPYDADREEDLEGGPGPQVAMFPEWQFRLNKRDSLLVLKALGGRLKAGPETEAAKELGDRLTVLRAKIGREYSDSLERAEAMMKATQDASPKPPPI